MDNNIIYRLELERANDEAKICLFLNQHDDDNDNDDDGNYLSQARR